MTSPTAADPERPLEPLWRGLLVYRVLALVSAGVVVLVPAAAVPVPGRRGRGAGRDGRLDRRHGYGYLVPSARARRAGSRSPTSWSRSR